MLESGDTKVVVSKYSWNVSYYYKDKLLTSGGWRSTGVIKESAFKQQARLAAQIDDTFWSFPADEHRLVDQAHGPPRAAGHLRG